MICEISDEWNKYATLESIWTHCVTAVWLSNPFIEGLKSDQCNVCTACGFQYFSQTHSIILIHPHSNGDEILSKVASQLHEDLHTTSEFCWHHCAPCPKLNMIWYDMYKKNRASDNKGKFHSFLMCGIWIYSKKNNSDVQLWN